MSYLFSVGNPCFAAANKTGRTDDDIRAALRTLGIVTDIEIADYVGQIKAVLARDSRLTLGGAINALTARRKREFFGAEAPETDTVADDELAGSPAAAALAV